LLQQMLHNYFYRVGYL